MNGVPGVVPLTPQELKTLHGLTVDQGLRMGYCIQGHVEEYRRAHKAALALERKALGSRAADYDLKPGHAPARTDTRRKMPPQPNFRVVGTFTYIPTPKIEKHEIATEIREEIDIMDKSTRILLLIHLMSSGTFADMPQTEKALLLTELLYGKEKPESAAVPKAEKKTGGRTKKAAAPADQTEGDEV